MKKAMILSISFLSVSCSSTSYVDNDPQIDINKLYCPKDTIEYCEGPNRKMLTCKCVEQVSIKLPGIIF